MIAAAAEQLLQRAIGPEPPDEPAPLLAPGTSGVWCAIADGYTIDLEEATHG